MIGVFEVPMAIVAASVSGDQVVLVVETESVGIRFEGESLTGSVGRNRVVIGVEGDAKLPGGAHLRHGADIEGMDGESIEMGLFSLP